MDWPRGNVHEREVVGIDPENPGAALTVVTLDSCDQFQDMV